MFDLGVVCGDSVHRSPGLIDTTSAISRHTAVLPSISIAPGSPGAGVEFSFEPMAGRLALGRDLRLGEFACAIQHQRAYERVLASAAKTAVIVEDDCVLRVDAPRATALANWLSGQGRPTVVIFHRPQYVYLRREQDIADMKLRRISGRPLQTVAYAINRDAARLLRAQDGSYLGLADWPAHSLAGVRWFAVSDENGTPAADEADVPSSIDSASADTRSNGSKRWRQAGPWVRMESRPRAVSAQIARSHLGRVALARSQRLVRRVVL